MRIKSLWIVLIGLLVACASPSDLPAPTPLYADTTVPELDRSKHSVPLEKIYFDTFQSRNRAVSLTNADSALITRLRDAIPPIHTPQYEVASDAKWLSGKHTVVGYAAGDQAWAYPVNILNYHEIVTEVINGEPVLISYCPLCGSGIVYSRVVDGETLTFGNTSALYESDMVMLDYESGSYWWQVAGTAIAGTRTGQKLTTLPSQTTTWDAWRTLYPHTKVLSRETGFDRDYTRDVFGTYAGSVNRGNFAFPVDDALLDERLLPGTRMLAVERNNSVTAFALNQEQNIVHNVLIDNQPSAIFLEAHSESGAAFDAMIDGSQLTFSIVDGAFVDDQSGSTWTLAGQAVTGEYSGRQLVALPTKTTFWFALISAEPDLTLFSP